LSDNIPPPPPGEGQEVEEAVAGEGEPLFEMPGIGAQQVREPVQAASRTVRARPDGEAERLRTLLGDVLRELEQLRGLLSV